MVGLGLDLAAGEARTFDLTLALTAAAATTGFQLGFTGPAMDSFLAVIEYQSSATAWTTQTLGALPAGAAAGTLVTATYAAAPTPVLVRITGVCKATAAGRLQLRARSEVAGSAITVKAGSSLRVV